MMDEDGDYEFVYLVLFVCNLYFCKIRKGYPKVVSVVEEVDSRSITTKSDKTIVKSPVLH